MVTAGREAGKTGTVKRLNKAKGTALVEGLNLVKKAVPRSSEQAKGGITEKEAPIALSNLMPYDPKQKKGVRISRVQEGGKAVREAKGGSGHRFA